MSQGSSNPASPSRPVPASEQQETITPVSHVFGLSEVSTSLEALNIEVEKKPNVVHRAQTSYSPGVSRTPWECRYYQEHLASLHQPSGLSATAAPFQPRAAPPLPRLAETASDQHK